MPYEYNPLLKDGLQKVSNGGGGAEQIAALQEAVSVLQQQAAMLQTALNTLKGNKITKCFTSADFAALETNEIFEWQGETTTIDGTPFVNGFFYKKIVGQQTLPSGTKYFLYEENYPTITKNGYVFTPGNYYHLDTITPANGSNFYNYALYQWNGISRYYFLPTTGVNLQVGDLVWDNQDYNFVTVVSLDDNGKPTLSNGEYISEGGKTGGSFVEIIDCKNSDGTAFSFIKSNIGRIVVHYTLNDNVFTLIDWFFVYVVTRTTTTPQTIGVDSYTQTNTQPESSYTLPTAAANVLGGVKVGNNLSIDANGVLSASGSGYTLPIAAANVLGGVKVGSGLSIDANGVLSLNEDSTVVFDVKPFRPQEAEVGVNSFNPFAFNNLLFFDIYIKVKAGSAADTPIFAFGNETLMVVAKPLKNLYLNCWDVTNNGFIFDSFYAGEYVGLPVFFTKQDLSVFGNIYRLFGCIPVTLIHLG